MSINECTLAPTFPASFPPPAPTDWTSVLLGNCFSNLQRLGLWAGGADVLVKSGEDPSKYFRTVTTGSLGTADLPTRIYVVVHGWAPGYRDMVTQNGGDVLWWGAQASAGGVWASEWAWSPVSASTWLSGNITINSTGMLQSIMGLDADAIALAWSWIDESATESGTLNLQEVYASEAYTHANGIRLAYALKEAINPAVASSVQINLIGHSHGSKVATVAALTLQELGLPAAHLTILDSPESDTPLRANGANLLGFYLNDLPIQQSANTGISGVFVDNYTSYFGVGYTGSAKLNNVVEVALYAGALYDFDDISEMHTYTAAWYGGAANGAETAGDPPVGLAWPPAPTDDQPTLNQNWTNGDQWLLQTGDTINDNGNYTYTSETLTISNPAYYGSAQAGSGGNVLFGPGNGMFQCDYATDDLGSLSFDQYGISFDLQWSDPQPEDYLVVSVTGNATYTLLVLDGQSLQLQGQPKTTRTSVAINADTWTVEGVATLDIYFVPSQSNSASQVTISNLQEVNVSCADCLLSARRKAIALQVRGEKTQASAG